MKMSKLEWCLPAVATLLVATPGGRLASAQVTPPRRAEPLARCPEDVLPSIAPNLQAYYDFEHPARDNRAREVDQGRSGTDIALINGGEQMRVRGGAYRGSRWALSLGQKDPSHLGNDDWKAGVFAEGGVGRLSAFNAVKGTTIMGWVEMGSHETGLNTNTPEPDDRYNAIGLAGILSGNSDGHGVRALLEVINVNGELRLVALGRRLDDGRSQTLAATEDWRTLMPLGQWVHLAATFDFGSGTMQLYRNGQPISGTYTSSDDPWQVAGGGDFATSATHPRGIKLGGSFPQNTVERNPCNCRMDSLMFIDRVVTQVEVDQQYRRMVGAEPGRQ